MSLKSFLGNFYNNLNKNDSYNNECIFCLNIITKNNKIILNCKHAYHINCILKYQNNKCPLCKQKYNLIKYFNIILKYYEYEKSNTIFDFIFELINLICQIFILLEIIICLTIILLILLN